MRDRESEKEDRQAGTQREGTTERHTHAQRGARTHARTHARTRTHTHTLVSITPLTVYTTSEKRQRQVNLQVETKVGR